MRIFHQTLAVVGVAFLSACASGGKTSVDLSDLSQTKLNEQCLSGITGACALLGQDVKPLRSLAVLQGVTSRRETRIVIQTPDDQNYRYFVRSKLGVKAEKASSLNLAGTGALDTLELFDLNPGEQYELIAVDPAGTLWDRRTFRSLDVTKKNARLAVVSCMDDSWVTTEQKQMWTELLAQKPDVILMIGDNVYADGGGVATQQQLMKRYAQTRATLEVFKARHLVPILATWDDHDFGVNNGDRTYKNKDASRSVFFAFFPQEKPMGDFSRGPGVSSAWSAFGVDMALLDNRSFRSPNGLDLADQTHFGSAQEKWIAKGLSEAKKPVLLVSGDQFFGAYHQFESYEGSHPKSFKVALKEWSKAKSPILFVSGDRHLAEIIQVSKKDLGYSTYEVTSSGIHVKTYPDSFLRFPSPNQVEGVAGQLNYTILDVQKTTPILLQVGVESFGLGNKSQYKQTLTVKRR